MLSIGANSIVEWCLKFERLIEYLVVLSYPCEDCKVVVTVEDSVAPSSCTILHCLSYGERFTGEATTV
jgi:hypothetical protein